MKKILFISTRYPLPVLAGDKIRAVGILKFLSKKNKVDLVCLKNRHTSTNHEKICNNIKSFKINLIERFVYTILSLLKGEPLQVGFYYSHKMKSYINKVKLNYNTIIFHSVRACQYMPSDFAGKNILEMTDLLSLRYEQTIKQLSVFNPVKFIYLIEKFLIQKYEKKIIKKFNKTILVSKEDINNTQVKFNKKKVFFIKNGSYLNKNLFKFSEKNSKILFIGNIKYPPNNYACYEFAKDILPEINHLYPNITFNIVGEISVFDKLILKKYKNVVVHGALKNLDPIAKYNICGICNLRIATGFQNKIAHYMSYGIPTIASFISASGSDFIKNKEILVYKKRKELIKNIILLKENKNEANKLSNLSHKAIRKRYNWDKTLFNYSKIV